MNYRRILTVQDISCVGQCSSTVALPILSACGHETCVLPTSLLSTHTTGFSGFTKRDFSSDIPGIYQHWLKEGLRFDAIYTGYLGQADEARQVLNIAANCRNDPFTLFVDPAMADNGELYPGFDPGYVEAMKSLCASADYLLPNVTEACFLTGFPYEEKPDESYILALLNALRTLCPQTIVLTGVELSDHRYGVALSQQGEQSYYLHEKYPDSFHGTGDVFASVFVGAILRGIEPGQAVKISADFTLQCIQLTSQYPEHWYGMMFEPLIHKLLQTL